MAPVKSALITVNATTTTNLDRNRCNNVTLAKALPTVAIPISFSNIEKTFLSIPLFIRARDEEGLAAYKKHAEGNTYRESNQIRLERIIAYFCRHVFFSRVCHRTKMTTSGARDIL